MANMSYCRFHNTRLDVEDCIEALKEAEWDGEKISADEIRECKIMFDSIIEYLDYEGIIYIGEFDYDAYEGWKSNLNTWVED
jgi:hypothetical protein